MKKILMVAIALSVATGCAFAQEAKEINKERKELAKYSKQQLNERASKAAEKEAKKLRKEGWLVSPGALPLEKQLDRAYMMQYEFDEDLFPKYMSGQAQSTGGNYDAAHMQAMELAKQDLAGQIQTEITALVENTVANDQLDKGDAASITKSISASKNLISQSIGRVIPVVEVYRELKNKNKEVRVMIMYNSEMAKQAAKKAIIEDLSAKGEDLHAQLDKVLGF